MRPARAVRVRASTPAASRRDGAYAAAMRNDTTTRDLPLSARRRPLRLPAVLLLLAATLPLAGCGGDEPAAKPAWTPITQADMSETQLSQQSRGMEAKGELFARLFTRLQQAFGEGPGAAIGACKIAAPEIAQAVSSEKALRIGRTSHKLRNPANVPPPWAVSYVEDRHAEPVWLANQDGRLAGLLPIKAMDLCLRCHGEEASIAKPIREALAKEYPGDNATGFKAGDLRGWFWLEIPAP